MKIFVWNHAHLDQYGVDQLNNEDAFGLGFHINSQLKRAKNSLGKKEQFFPIPRFVDDGLFRFAKGMAKCSFENTPEDNYPAPWNDLKPINPKAINKTALPDNVISISEFRKN